MSKEGIDFAFYPHPSPAAVKSAGYGFVGRYVSPSAASDTSGKNLLPAELHLLRGSGLEVILFEEQDAGRMKGGKAAGVADAQHFDAVTKALGMTGAVMFPTADWDASEADQAPINAYLDGTAQVLGRARTGLYGGFWPVSRALTAGKAAFAVQTYAWSAYRGGALPAHAEKWTVGNGTYLLDSRANVRQAGTFTLAGADCDRLTALTADFGQWPRPVQPAPPGPAAEWSYEAPGGFAAHPGAHSVTLSWTPPAHPGEPAPEYIVWIYKGHGACNAANLLSAEDYPRHGITGTSHLFGGLDPAATGITAYTAHISACGPDGTHLGDGVYDSVQFTVSG